MDNIRCHLPLLHCTALTFMLLFYICFSGDIGVQVSSPDCGRRGYTRRELSSDTISLVLVLRNSFLGKLVKHTANSVSPNPQEA